MSKPPKKPVATKATRKSKAKRKPMLKRRPKPKRHAAKSRAKATRVNLSALEKRLAADEIRRAVEDGMQDLRMEKPV